MESCYSTVVENRLYILKGIEVTEQQTILGWLQV